MEMTAEAKKNLAEYFLIRLDVSSEYVIDFEENDVVYLFENGRAERIEPGTPLHNEIAALEACSGGRVYAVTHEYASFGELYSFLYVSKYEEDAPHMVRKHNAGGDPVVYGYCRNVSDDKCSEFGYMVIRCRDGKIQRVV